MQLKKRWGIIGLAGIIIIAVIVGYPIINSSRGSGNNGVQQPTAKAERGNIDVIVSGTGTLQPFDRQSVKPSEAATVDQVHVDEGNIVKEGDILVSFKAFDNSDQLRTQKNNLAKMELELRNLQKQYKNAGTEDERETIQSSIERQRMDVQVTEATIADLEGDQAPIAPIRAPISGEIVNLDVKAGDAISPQQVVAEVVNYNQLLMKANIDELDIAEVEVGQSATVQVEAIPEREYTGKVVSISKEGISTNGISTFEVKVLLGETDLLRSGMSAEAFILTQSKQDVLLLPIAAVEYVEDRSIVRIAPEPSGDGAGEPEERQVEVGIYNEDDIEILSGLTEGDTVLLPLSSVDEASSQQGFGPQGEGGGFGGGGGGLGRGGF